MMNKRLRIQAAETKLAFREMSAASSGLLGLAAAGGLTMGLSKAIGQGSNLAHEMQMLRNAGLSSRKFADSMQAAFATAKVLPTSTWEDNLKVIKETRGAFGDLHHALENLTFNQKLGAQLSNMLKIDPSEASHSIATAVQALEIRGLAMDIGRYQREMGLAYKAMVQTGGRFTADELKAFSGTANIPIKGYSERFLLSIIPSNNTELGGGDVAGTLARGFCAALRRRSATCRIRSAGRSWRRRPRCSCGANRKEIAGAWHALTGWFTNTAWPAIKSTVMSVNWAAVGSSIVDGMTFGLASKLPNMLSTVHRFLKSEVGFNMKDGLTLTPPPAVAGARASGGPSRRAGHGSSASRGQSLSCPIDRAR